MVVAVAVGRQGIDSLLVASQVALSIVLPFVIFPLVYLASSEVVMRVPRPEGGFASFKNSWLSMSLGYLIFTVVVVANVSTLSWLVLDSAVYAVPFSVLCDCHSCDGQVGVIIVNGLYCFASLYISR